jgi:radical SAM superfamily enzyme YgiQ (UPF0313 family)
MKYEGVIIRPPSEAQSLLLQVTVGCSHNRCTFCPTYKGAKFRIKSHNEIMEDIREAGRYRSVERVFLCDGDALIIPQDRLTPILQTIGANIQGVKRVGCYGNAKSILRKSTSELADLHELGLKIIYLGVETGDENLLKKIDKGSTYAEMVSAGSRVKEAGIILSVTVLLGIGGVEGSMEHAIQTARILSDIDPDYASALTLMIVPGTPLYDEWISGRFVHPDAFGFLEELKMIIANARFTDCYFTSNHASNYLPVRARLPAEKEKTIQKIDEIIRRGDKNLLKPEYLRGL